MALRRDAGGLDQLTPRQRARMLAAARRAVAELARREMAWLRLRPYHVSGSIDWPPLALTSDGPPAPPRPRRRRKAKPKAEPLPEGRSIMVRGKK
jgi:hypothetical protein